MGSPLGPILADIFMSMLETKVLNQHIEKLDFYCRYVDDTFILCDNRTDINKLLNIFNGAHHLIKFTMESESNQTLPFLDVLLVKRPDGSLQRSVYRKPTWTGQYINFNSFVPLIYKRNLIRCLAYRARRICTHDTIENELVELHNILLKNGYPDKFIQVNLKHQPRTKTSITVPKKTLFIKLPFKDDIITEALRTKLNRSIANTFRCAQLKLVLTGSPMLRFNLKDKLPRLTTSMCIYQFTCSCGVRYIGRTTRQLHKRIKEHHPVGLTRGTISTIRSSILKHLVDSNHSIDIEKAFHILYTTPVSQYFTTRTKHLNMAEAILINFYKPELCSRKSFCITCCFPGLVYFVEFFVLCCFVLLCFILFYLILFNYNYI